MHSTSLFIRADEGDDNFGFGLMSKIRHRSYSVLGSQQGLEMCGLNELSARRLACSFFLSFTGNFTWVPFTLIRTFILSFFVSCLMNFYQLIRFLVGDLYYIRLSKVQEINNRGKVLKGFFRKTSAWQHFELSAL